MVEFGLFGSVLVALIGGAAGGAFTPWFNARIEKAEKRRNLFEPIYDNISNIGETGLYRDNAKKWNSMRASDQLLVPPNIEEELNEYSEKCSKYRTMHTLLFYGGGEFDSILLDELYSVSDIRVPSSDSENRVVNIPLPRLILRLKLHACENPNELRMRIVQDAEHRDEIPYLNSIQYLNTDYPDWTSDIHDVLQSETGRQWITHRQEVQEYAKNLKPKLRKCVLSRFDRLKRVISRIF